MTNYSITRRNLLEILYRDLNANAKAIIETITGQAFMSIYGNILLRSYNRLKINLGWQTRGENRSVDTYEFKASNKHQALDETVDHKV